MPMTKVILPLALALAAGTALACPGEGKSMDAKVDLSPSVAAALAAKAPPARAELSQKEARPKDAAKPAVEAKKSTT
ncbi:MAG: hypothetical protein OEU93_07870 [Rubrivivax sp.]|nr:hypothetical protein [Rubrivivax sp.]